MSGSKESKTKKSKLTVPLHPTTPVRKRTVEIDIQGEEFAEAGASLIVHDDKGTESIMNVKEVLEGD